MSPSNVSRSSRKASIQSPLPLSLSPPARAISSQRSGGSLQRQDAHVTELPPPKAAPTTTKASSSAAAPAARGKSESTNKRNSGEQPRLPQVPRKGGGSNSGGSNVDADDLIDQMSY